MKGIKSLIVGLGFAGWLREPVFTGGDVQRLLVGWFVTMVMYVALSLWEVRAHGRG